MHYLAMRSMCVAALTAMALSCAAVLARAEPVTQFPDTSRIVSIGGALTEIVYALGAEKMLVARDDTSLYPPEALKLKSVGYMRRLSPESVLSVNPSGILLVEGSGPPETLDVLKKASVPMVIVPDKYTAEGVTAKIEAVGKALGLEDKAKVLAEKVSADLDAVEKRVSAHNPRKRVLFILSMQGGRLMASGTGTAADGIIKLAGGVNVIDQYPGYKQLTDEAIEKAAPDVILMINNGGHSAASTELLKNPAIAETPAGRSGDIVAMDGLYLLGFGPRTGEAVRDLSEKLYGAADAK
ncbi:MAG: ABC transporter substrate-binding protein [Rhizobiales bacterium]|nr:ABC transporter substrate-binding protein [Hyphomicrobiales bacterium]OJY01417.1 MAG: hemin ABC transporter substrate-binding protein [Rhizobiales bacterium 63-22]